MKSGCLVPFMSIVVLAVACEPVALPAPSVPSAPPARTQVERVWIDDPRFRVYGANEMIVDGDRELMVGVDFVQPPHHEQIEPALRVGLPAGSVIEWPSDTRVSVRVPPGGAFDVDLSGAQLAPNSSLTALKLHVDRPTYEVALYRANEVLAGSLTPVRTWTVSLAVQHVASFAPDGHRVLVHHGITPRRTDFSLVDLDTGRKTTLATPFMAMAENGTALMDWLPDGRLLGVAHATSFIGDGDGQHPEQLPGLLGQSAVLSPSRHLVALWSYADSTAAILDLATGKLRPLPGTFPRCTVGGIVSLSWVDEDRIAISDCTVDLEGTPRTRELSARTGATLQTRLGDQLVTTLASGVEWRARVTPAHTMSSPQPLYWLADRAGRVIATLDGDARYLPAPDGTALAYARPDRQHSVVIDPATGQRAEIVGEAMTWTKQGELAVVRRL
ncbi:MAG: hypothetical protein M3T56_11685 [Chloroflexota bacterium]|nr:hypothetical protein [Chloroflexota bacterium]